MIKTIFNIAILSGLNFIIFINSESIDIDQIYYDFENIGINSELTSGQMFLFIGVSVSILTIFLIMFFKPFIEIYLLHYLRYSFYFLINLLSISSVFITLRIYGYSRLYLFMYLMVSSFIFILSDKNYYVKQFKNYFSLMNSLLGKLLVLSRTICSKKFQANTRI